METIEVAGSKYKIRAKSYIEDYAALKEVLNALAAELNLPIAINNTGGTKPIVDDGPSVRL